VPIRRTLRLSSGGAVAAAAGFATTANDVKITKVTNTQAVTTL
jgi:hypothetical protein